MQNKIKYLLICVFYLPLLVGAQQADNSPFSAFGIGNLNTDDLAYFQGMGGLGASYMDPYHLNIKNPASYAFLNATAYEIGISARYFQLSDGSNSNTGWTGNLDYIALGFPLRNPINASLDPVKKDYKLGMSFILKPHSSVGYNISSFGESENLGAFRNSFEGNGGLYKFMWGNSIKYKNVSFGANIGYLFGNINYSERIIFEQAANAFQNRYNVDYNVNGFIWDAGAAYSVFLNKKAYENDKTLRTKIINIGLYGNSAQNFNTVSDVTERVVLAEYAGQETSFSADTLSSQRGLSGTGRLPAELGLGLTFYNGDKYAVGFNFDYGAWSGYKNSIRSETLSDSWGLSIGGSYRPDAKSFNNYFKRVSYKMGFFYKADPQVVDNIQVTDAGLNLGATFPFYYQRKISHINAAFRFGARGSGTPIQELYGKVTVGFTFNDDEWFIKRKYN